tara:strand:- start:198 stop:389 length:192 start_codon:yes stop_codon:yes gene_type:complete
MLFIVSVTFEVVSVWDVIDPCWKFGTTGTAFTGAVMAIAITAPRAYVFFVSIYERFAKVFLHH